MKSITRRARATAGTGSDDGDTAADDAEVGDAFDASSGPRSARPRSPRLKQKELDILVVGGGIVGTGAALDAVTRGLSTGLLEARDWASGTSSRSSKLVHGGIRYLEQLDFRLVREALIERGLLLQRIAPHLVKPVRFLYPAAAAASSSASTSAPA